MKKLLTSDCKRAIYIGRQDSREHALSYGMTGYYDPIHKIFLPDGQLGYYHGVPEDCYKITTH